MDRAHDEEERGARLRQRLWGAAVLIAILVIVLPLLLDGSGSESQFRRVERLRQEPPRVIGNDGQPEVGAARAVDPFDARLESPAEPALRIRIGEDDPPDYMSAVRPSTRTRERPRDQSLRAWVVQAGSFAERDNAIAVRDRLRRAGHPSFVSDAIDGDSLFRVQVGPMIDELAAQATRDAVVALLGREAIVVSYP